MDKTENLKKETISPDTRKEKSSIDPHESRKTPEEIYGIEDDEHYAG